MSSAAAILWLDLVASTAEARLLPRHDEAAQAMGALSRALVSDRAGPWQVRALVPQAARAGELVLMAGGFAREAAASQVDVARDLAGRGVRVAVMVHDLVRLRRPEWFAPSEQGRFQIWLDGMLAVAQLVLVPSEATGRDLAQYVAERGIAAKPIRRMPMGDTLLEVPAAGSSRLPHPFVLVPTPIDTRRNQDVLVEGWRRLALRAQSGHGAGHAAGKLPLLVLAGLFGEMSRDLALRLGRAGTWQIALHPAKDDAALAALYRDCAFVIIPSLHAGWGAHVTQSLACGKPVFAAKAAALPEAGGRLARYFDPLDPEDLARAVDRVLRDPPDLARWQAEIARDHRRRSWQEAARSWLAALA